MRGCVGSACLSLVGVLVSPAVVSAQEAEDKLVSVDPWQAVFTILVFIGLLVVLRAFAFKPILQVLKQREDFIRSSLEQAKRERELAEQRRREYEGKLEEAREESRKMLAEAQRQAEATQARLEQEAHRNAAEMIERARHEIAVARDEAVRKMYEEAIELASQLAQAALKRQMTPEEHQRLVLDSLRELAQRPGYRA